MVNTTGAIREASKKATVNAGDGSGINVYKSKKSSRRAQSGTAKNSMNPNGGTRKKSSSSSGKKGSSPGPGSPGSPASPGDDGDGSTDSEVDEFSKLELLLLFAGINTKYRQVATLA